MTHVRKNTFLRHALVLVALIILGIVFSSTYNTVSTAHAEQSKAGNGDPGQVNSGGDGYTGSPTGAGSYTSGPTGVGVNPVSTEGGFSLPNPLNVGTFCGLLQQILRALLVFGIPIAVLVVIYSGFRFVLARGNMEELKVAKRNLYYVVIGLLLFLGAWMLGQIVANTLNQLGAGTANGTIGSCI